jgi:ribosomal protein L11 methyltransferase
VDPDSVAVTRENAARNGLEALLLASDADVSRIEGRFPVVVANIEARVLVPMAEALSARVAPGGRLYLSGILAGQEDEIARAYVALGAPEIVRMGEWVMMVFER